MFLINNPKIKIFLSQLHLPFFMYSMPACNFFRCNFLVLSTGYKEKWYTPHGQKFDSPHSVIYYSLKNAYLIFKTP